MKIALDRGAAFGMLYGMDAMNAIERGAEALQKCEQDIRKIMAEAAESGDYEAVTRLTAIAKQLKSLGGNASSGATTAGTAGPAKSKKKRRRSKKGTQPTGYPKFLRRGENLVKLGWSRRERKEYQHSAPKELVLVVARAIAEAGASGKLITSEDFLPVTIPQEGTEVPQYQAYLALAWLVDQQLVEKHGRRGYTTPSPATLETRVEERWTKLVSG